MKVCIIGVGFVGEHLMNVFRKRYNVVALDLNQKRIDYLKQKYADQSTDSTIVEWTSCYENISECDVFLISVPTLVKPDGEMDVSCLYSVRDQLLTRIKPGSLIVVESSVYVGATRELFGHFIDRGVHVAFSPERVDPGRKEPPTEKIPKIISGLTEACLAKCNSIYSQVFEKVVKVSKPETAEMCKLYENCFRMVNIAYINEIADMCVRKDIDVYEMIDASATKPFGFMPFYPGVGVGGHCIPVNPYYLLHNGSLPVLHYATKLMEKRPKLKAHELVNAYPEANRIIVMGIGFKRGESLTTNSPGYQLYKELLAYDKTVSVYDPIVQAAGYHTDITFVADNHLEEALADTDLVVITLPVANETRNLLNMYFKQGGQIYSFVPVH
jgi:nucleotide sugar dehydrogenase